ncbi:hypothetical protein LRS10_22865 [Phenylobacterium sp. J426]|uniref:hypothetical protein n=1 Tax=Phenylobacterium sp. J426 TaxID=2898439 RepID=UPI002150E311|nr:hypothetical protein [Phenylobacterium sp. J426]MCR5876747.1 hypothetical protein [Phenylobacterium sp. J426]
MHVATAKELVLRALVAAEIAESCTHSELRRQFYALSELWLDRARTDAGQAPEKLGSFSDLNLAPRRIAEERPRPPP